MSGTSIAIGKAYFLSDFEKLQGRVVSELVDIAVRDDDELADV